ncbi:MAG TPA: ABC transporter permease [Longimicrobiales bacterium]|nr:ABC transporter permease [Longimicrobiales bacterium]
MSEHVPPRGQLGIVWAELRRHRLAVASGALLAVVAAACALAPVLAPYEFDAIDLAAIRQPPSPGHWMGTDDLGRDLLTRVLHGGRVSILIGVLSAVLGTVLGSGVGVLAGWFGRRLDNVLMRLTDVAYAIPTLPLLIVLASYTSADAASMALVIGLLSWMGTARVVRGEVLSLREMAFVEAARGVGAGHVRIILRHLLPNALGPIVVGATLAVGNAIILESSLSFLGLGVQPPTPTWGNMLMDAQATMATKPWLTVFPGLAILAVVLSVNFIGDGLRDALDPMGRGRRGS